MDRDISALQETDFDVVVVGGGIHGACIARDAALRGLRVALVEMADFNSATSHNSLKTIHGGIRYLQHLNVKRAIESIREQQIFLRTLPHLVQPLRFMMPTYGFGMRGPFVMGVGIVMFEALSAAVAIWDRRWPGLPKGRLLRKATCLRQAPGLDPDGLTGGAIWADAQITFADKAVFEILAHACDHGAVVANYVKAERLRFAADDPTHVSGVQACDTETGESFAINARCVVNATGPWIGDWLGGSDQTVTAAVDVDLVRSMNLVTRKPAPATAIAVKSTRASDSKIDTAKRMFFVVHWQGKAVIGTTHFSHTEATLEIMPDQAEIAQFVAEYNAADPEMGLTVDDVLYCYLGLAPGENSTGTDGAPLHESKIVDHGQADRINGLLSIISVKWTTARLVAERTVDQVMQHLGQKGVCQTRDLPVPDTQAMPHDAAGLTDAQLHAFVQTHVNVTQARHLDDIVLRRTHDVTLGKLSADQVRVILGTLADRFDWSPAQQDMELAHVLDRLPPSHNLQSLKVASPG